jgi:hypothetical protein
LLGYNGGNWTPASGQPYIVSSAAAAVAADSNNLHKTGVGYAEASAIFGPGGGTFAGEAVDGDAVLVRYTYLGDANLDGKVNALDFNILASNFGNPNFPNWSQADFNYDSSVDTADFNLLAMNYNLALAAPPLGGLVPEPSVIATLALMTAFGCRRRLRARC